MIRRRLASPDRYLCTNRPHFQLKKNAHNIEKKSFNPSPLQNLLPLHNTLPKAQQEHCPTGPHLRRLIMRRHLRLKPTPITHTFDDPRDEGRAVQHAHFPRHADVSVYERVVVGDHVLVGTLGGDGVFQGICGTVEEETPEGAVDEVEEGEDT